MSEGSRRKIDIQRYQSVTDQVSRKVYKLDRYRLSAIGLTSGIAAIAFVYWGVTLAAVAVLSALPISGQILGLLPWSLTWIGLPVCAAWALSAFKIDGRPPHRVAFALVRFRASPRTLAGLRPCPEAGTEFAPLAEVHVAATGDEDRYRPGRVVGPAKLVLRYTVRARRDGAGRLLSHLPGRRGRLRLATETASRRPLPHGEVIELAAGGEVVFE